MDNTNSAKVENTQQIIPVVLPKNKAGKTVENLFAFLLSLIPLDKQDEFIRKYKDAIHTLPFELDGPLSVQGGWGTFVIDLMCNASILLKEKHYTFVDINKMSRICAISFLGLLDMYELNTGRSKYYGQFFTFRKDEHVSLFSAERAIFLCNQFGITLDETDIECIFFTKNISNGEKMTITHASPTARVFFSAYMLTKADHSL